MKTVEVFGKIYEVENRFKYVAVDGNGDVWAYVNLPMMMWGSVYYPTDGFDKHGEKYKRLGVLINHGGINFEPTLIEVE